jgi:hypothetical protein
MQILFLVTFHNRCRVAYLKPIKTASLKHRLALPSAILEQILNNLKKVDKYKYMHTCFIL